MADPPAVEAKVAAPLPRITIQFCTQCKWMLRAAYLAQELLSTFSLSLGEVALQPSTGGTFIVTITHPSLSSSASEAASSPTQANTVSTVLWDRKSDGGFPETKELKRRVRDVIQPDRDLGHVDRNYPAPMNKKDTLERGPGPVTGEMGTLASGSGQAAGNTYKLKPNSRATTNGVTTASSNDAAITGDGAAKCEDCN